MRALSVSLLALVALGCGSPSDENSSERLETPSSCSTGSDCNGCGSCLEECLCQGTDGDTCSLDCGAKTEPEVEVNPDPIDNPEPLTPPPTRPPPVEEPLGPPLDGIVTKTIVTDAFRVGPGEEVFRCQNFSNPFRRGVAIVKTESVMAEGSHHMFVFQGSYSNGDLTTCGGLEFGPYVHLSQRPVESFAYPTGVGRALEANEGLRVQMHYVNTTPEPIDAAVAVTLQAEEIDQVAELASYIFINTMGISVPPFSAGGAQNSCGIPHDLGLLYAGSHMHQHGVYFEARTSDGALVYETNDWAEPTPWRFDPAMQLRAGSTVNIDCTYENDSALSLSFGESAVENEMCIFTAGYYPATRGEAVNCLF